MKFIFKLIPLLALCVILFQDCNKYPDGPKFSLRTRKARLTGNWKYESIKIGELDVTSLVTADDPDWRLDIESNGTYNIQGKYSDHGKWKFGEDYDDVYLNSTVDPSKPEYAMRVTRLLNNSIWFTTTATNGVKTYFRIKQ